MATVFNHAFVPFPRAAPFKGDSSRGRRIWPVSSERFSRPDGERFLSLDDLLGATLTRNVVS